MDGFIHLVSVHDFSKALFLTLGVKLFNEEQITECIISGLCKISSLGGFAELLILEEGWVCSCIPKMEKKIEAFR